jgi:hypothetical protein
MERIGDYRFDEQFSKNNWRILLTAMFGLVPMIIDQFLAWDLREYIDVDGYHYNVTTMDFSDVVNGSNSEPPWLVIFAARRVQSVQ